MISFKRFGARVTHGDSMVLYPRWRAPALDATVAGDMVWEPFGGTCPAARVTLELAGRESESAEVSVEFYESAKKSFSMLSQSTG